MLWTTFVAGGDTGPDYARDVSISADNEIFVAGAMNTGADDRDIWVGRLSP